MVTFASERKPIRITNTRHSTITHKRYISHEIQRVRREGQVNACEYIHKCIYMYV